MNVLLVYKKSKLELYSNSKDKDVRRFLETDNAEQLRASHTEHSNSMVKLLIALNAAKSIGLTFDSVWRAHVDVTKGRDLIISVGGDGTFLDVARYVTDGTPVLGINSDPSNSKGFYCCHTTDSFVELLERSKSTDNFMESILLEKTVANRIIVDMHGGKKHLVMNDILIAHENPASMTHLLFSEGRAVDVLPHIFVYNDSSIKCSGVLVSAPGGSTAWMKNVGGSISKFDTNQMQYLARDVGSTPRYANHLRVKSLTRQGRIYMDGEYNTDKFGLGASLTMSMGNPLTVIGNLDKKRELKQTKTLHETEQNAI